MHIFLANSHFHILKQQSRAFFYFVIFQAKRISCEVITIIRIFYDKQQLSGAYKTNNKKPFYFSLVNDFLEN